MFNEIQPLLDKFNQMKSSDLVPVVIYHYTSPSAFSNIVQHHHLWYSDRRFLNDQSEGINALDVLSNVIPVANISEELRDYLREKCEQKRNGVFSKGNGFYILSLSTDKDNLNLWNYYSKNNKLLGYNIGFEKNELLNSLRKAPEGKRPVEPIYGKVLYKYDEKFDIVKDIVEILSDSGEKFECQTVGDLIIERIMLTGCLFKADAFENEHEYRIVIPWEPEWEANIINIPPVEFRERDGFFIPYLLIDFDIKECIKNVTVSPTIDYNLAEASLKMLLRNYPRIEIRHSSIPVRY